MAEWFSRAQVREQLRALGYGDVSEETFEEFYDGECIFHTFLLVFEKRAKIFSNAFDVCAAAAGKSC